MSNHAELQELFNILSSSWERFILTKDQRNNAHLIDHHLDRSKSNEQIPQQ